jgi:hypothetical protein
VAFGASAVLTTALLGAFFHFRPGPTAIDRWGFALFPNSTNSSFFRSMTWFGSVTVLLVGAGGAAGTAWFTGQRDRWRAAACIIGPLAAAAANQFLLKPVVGRLYVGELSFASGSVIVIVGVGVAWVLAVPRRFRALAAIVGVIAAAMVGIAVVALQWHYPTDALVGAWFAAGTVFLVDGISRFLPGGTRRRSSATARSSVDPRPVARVTRRKSQPTGILRAAAAERWRNG